MPILTATQIYNLAVEAGFRGQDAINATAIALAESSGNTDVVNSIGATGLFQIYNGKGQNGLNDPTFKANMQDPLKNAKAAYAKFQASQQTTCGGWWPWASYNEGPCHNSDPDRNNSWRNFLGTATTGSQSGNASSTDTSTDPNLSAGQQLVAAASTTDATTSASAEPNTITLIPPLTLPGGGGWGGVKIHTGVLWAIGFFLLAGILLAIGVYLAFRQQINQAVVSAGKAAVAA